MAKSANEVGHKEEKEEAEDNRRTSEKEITESANDSSSKPMGSSESDSLEQGTSSMSKHSAADDSLDPKNVLTNSFPEPGWMFNPSDAELFVFLKRRLKDSSYESARIREDEVYTLSPDYLMDNKPIKYFFATRKVVSKSGKKSGKKHAFSRKVDDGSWQRRGKDKEFPNLGWKYGYSFKEDKWDGKTKWEGGSLYHLDVYVVDENDVTCICVMRYVCGYRQPYSPLVHVQDYNE